MEPSKALSRELALELDAANVYGILRFAWQRKKLISYVDLAKSLGMFSGGSQLAEALGRVMELTAHHPKHPLLSAIVTRVSNTDQRQVILGPGDGFYIKAQSLGFCPDAAIQKGWTTEDEKFQYWTKLLEDLKYDPTDLTFFEQG